MVQLQQLKFRNRCIYFEINNKDRLTSTQMCHIQLHFSPPLNFAITL